MSNFNKTFEDKLRKKILYNQQIVSIALRINKKKLNNRIDFNALKTSIEKRLQSPIVNDQATEHFYNELYTYTNFFIEYNKSVRGLAKIEMELYQSVSFREPEFEYAQTMIVEKALKNFEKSVSSPNAGSKSPAYNEVKNLIDSCKYANIKSKQNEKTM